MVKESKRTYSAISSEGGDRFDYELYDRGGSFGATKLRMLEVSGETLVNDFESSSSGASLGYINIMATGPYYTSATDDNCIYWDTTRDSVANNGVADLYVPITTGYNLSAYSQLRVKWAGWQTNGSRNATLRVWVNLGPSMTWKYLGSQTAPYVSNEFIADLSALTPSEKADVRQITLRSDESDIGVSPGALQRLHIFNVRLRK